MLVKNISAKITPEIEEQAQQHLKDLKALFPFLTDLPPTERRRMAKLSRRYVDFVDRSLFHARANPQYVPPYLDSQEFTSDVELKNSLHRIYAEVNALASKLRDTILVVESEAYASARIFYKSVQTAAKEGTEGAQQVAQDLAYNYKKKRSAKTDTEDKKPEPEKSS